MTFVRICVVYVLNPFLGETLYFWQKISNDAQLCSLFSETFWNKSIMINKIKIIFACCWKFGSLNVGAFFSTTLHTNTACVSVFPEGVLSSRGRSGSDLLKCVLREALVGRGSDGLHLKIAPVNTPVTPCECVCVSFTRVSLHNRKIRCTSVYLCASMQAGVCVRVCVCKYSWLKWTLCSSVT